MYLCTHVRVSAYVCSYIHAWHSDSGLSFDILLTTETGNWPLETLEGSYSYWYTSESWCLRVFVPHCLDILCVLSQNPLRNLHAPNSATCRLMIYLLSVTIIPCPALSVTLGWCKSNASKQTSHKHPRGVSCSICFSISHYCIMLLISHADKVKNDILFYVLIKELWSSSVCPFHLVSWEALKGLSGRADQ